MAQELVVFEKQLNQMLPAMQQALAGRMPPERLARTILVSCEKTPKLLECQRGSLISSAMTAAFLGLEVDGVTGQGFLVPYNIKNIGQVAQFQIGYKGFNTLGARSGYSISAAVVRDDDSFEYQLGTGAFLRHKPNLAANGRIIGAWAVAESKSLPAIISVLKLADLEAVQKKSQASAKGGGFSPWDDPNVGRPAMYEKTARRRLSRSMPMNALTRDYHLASLVEETFQERGLISHIRNDGQLVVEGSSSLEVFPPAQESETPPMSDLLGQKDSPDVAYWKRTLEEAADGGTDVLRKNWERIASPESREHNKLLARELASFKDGLKATAERADRGE